MKKNLLRVRVRVKVRVEVRVRLGIELISFFLVQVVISREKRPGGGVGGPERKCPLVTPKPSANYSRRRTAGGYYRGRCGHLADTAEIY